MMCTSSCLFLKGDKILDLYFVSQYLHFSQSRLGIAAVFAKSVNVCILYSEPCTAHTKS